MVAFSELGIFGNLTFWVWGDLGRFGEIWRDLERFAERFGEQEVCFYCNVLNMMYTGTA